MSEISRVSKTLIAYLKRPDLYPELGRKIVKNIFNRGNAIKGKDKTNSWAAAKASSQKEIVLELFGDKDFDFRQKYSGILKESFEKEKDCPVKMGGAGALELIYYAAEFTKATNIIETGVAYGWSSLAALLSLEKRNGNLYSSDMPYLGQNGDKFVGVVVPEKLQKFWKLFRFADKESLPKIFAQTSLFDVIHYDSDKSYDGRTWAYEELYKHLRKGGVFLSDDIGDNSAYQDFCEKNNIDSSVVEFEGKFVGVFIK